MKRPSSFQGPATTNGRRRPPAARTPPPATEPDDAPAFAMPWADADAVTAPVPVVGRAAPGSPGDASGRTASVDAGIDDRGADEAELATDPYGWSRTAPPAPAPSAPEGERPAGETDPAPPERSPSPSRLLREAALRRRARRATRREVRRFTRRSRHRRAALLTGAAGVVGLALFLVVGVFTPVFAVRDVEVVGADAVDAAAVEASLAGQLGVPLPLVDDAAVQQALQAYPRIESFRTEARLPGTLVVRVVERTPIAAVVSGSSWNVVDAAGVVLVESNHLPTSVPLVKTGSEGVASAAFAASVRVLRSLPADVFATVQRIEATTIDDVTFTLRDSDVRVVWGSEEDSAVKAQVLAAMLERTKLTGGKEVDVSSPTEVVVRPRTD